jgi:hypothetical protein
MKASRKFDIKKGKRARIGCIGQKSVADKAMKGTVCTSRIQSSQLLKALKIRIPIKKEGPTGEKLKGSGIAVPLMEGPTGILNINRVHERKINRSYGKRGIKKTESRKVY